MSTPTIISTNALPRQDVLSRSALKGDKGATPSIAMQGDQITVDGLVVGPHLTGPEGKAGPQNLHIGATAPADLTTPFLWVQTGLGADGNGVTLNLNT